MADEQDGAGELALFDGEVDGVIDRAASRIARTAAVAQRAAHQKSFIFFYDSVRSRGGRVPERGDILVPTFSPGRASNRRETAPGPSLRRAATAREPGIHRCRGRLARPRNRREQRDFPARRCRPAKDASGRETARARVISTSLRSPTAPGGSRREARGSPRRCGRTCKTGASRSPA